MKKSMLVVLAMFLLVGLASAQPGTTYKSVIVYGNAVGDTSVNAAFDTSVAFQVGAYPIVSFDVYSADKINFLNIHVLKCEEGKTAFAVVDSVVAYNGNLEGVLNRKEFMLRDGAVNKLAGTRAQFKLRPQYAGSGNDNVRVYIRVNYGGL